MAGGGKRVSAAPADDEHRGSGKEGQRRARVIKGKNTESFKPSHAPADMRVCVGLKGPAYGRRYGARDVVFVPELFCPSDDQTVFDDLLSELKASGSDSLFVPWHGDR